MNTSALAHAKARSVLLLGTCLFFENYGKQRRPMLLKKNSARARVSFSLKFSILIKRVMKVRAID
jgi:hypothetical protein